MNNPGQGLRDVPYSNNVPAGTVQRRKDSLKNLGLFCLNSNQSVCKTEKLPFPWENGVRFIRGGGEGFLVSSVTGDFFKVGRA
jgi:hypothetical protein